MKVEGAQLLDTCGGAEDSTGSYKNVSFNQCGGSNEMVSAQSVEIQRLTKNSLRGIHHSSHARIVSCIMGKVYVVVVDLRPESLTFREWDGVWVNAEGSEGDSGAFSVHCPPRCGLASYAPSGAMVLVHHCDQDKSIITSFPKGIIWNDTDINICWSVLKCEPVMSEDDASLPSLVDVQSMLCVSDFCCDVLLYGSTGYFGSHVLKDLKEKGVDVCCSRTRLENLPGLIQDSLTYRPRRVINCAGVTGKPNIMWCESNKPETARANFTGIINLLDVFSAKDVHVTTIGTGIIHSYDKDHRLDNEVGYTEEEPPSYDGNVYVRLRIAQEKMVEEIFPEKCLTLRVQYPISSDMHPGCCLSKLLKYPKIFGLPTSMTVLDDLFPYINDLSLKKVTGPLNFTNPGRMNNVELLERYKEIVDQSIRFECGTPEEMVKFLTIPRPFSLLDTSRLIELCPDVPSIQESVHNTLLKIATKKGQLSEAEL